MNLFKIGLAFAVAALIVGTGTVAGLFWHFSHGLPDHKQLADYQPPITSRLYAADGRLLAEYAKEKRVFVPAAAIPRRVKQAFVAAEDQRFFTHPGIDVLGLTRAVLTNIANPGRRMEGASGITQQVAKNFLLTNQATLARKIREAILAFRIEKAYSKEHILELYLNEIYLGAGNYGVGAAAMNYFDRSLGELSLSEIAYLAALPKAPNAYNINRHEKEAYIRRDYVLGRMQADGYITAEEAAAAKAERLVYRKRSTTDVVTADFFAEEVRRNLMAAYGEKGLYEGGLTVSTTLDPAIQEQADKALRDGLIAYDRRHGWRGPHAKIADMSVPWEEEFARIQQRRPLFGPSSWQLAVVTKVDAGSATVAGLPDNADGTIPFAEMTWARQSLPNQNVGAAPARPAALLSVGDVVVVEKIEKNEAGKPYPPKTYGLRQVPNVNGAVVVMDPATGRVLAMSGGWSYGMSQFNRAVQAQRQPGSSFKPFVYLAALQKGVRPATQFHSSKQLFDLGGGQFWYVTNSEDAYGKTLDLNEALAVSDNTVYSQLIMLIKPAVIADVAQRLGINSPIDSGQPAIGLGGLFVGVTPLEMAHAYATIANRGQRVGGSILFHTPDSGITDPTDDPVSITRIEFPDGRTLVNTPEAVQAVPENDALQVLQAMKGVIRFGTGKSAQITRPAVGKTGTTSDFKDAWFIGATPQRATAVWVGYENPARPMRTQYLGGPVYGGTFPALIWRDYMVESLRGQPREDWDQIGRAHV